MRNAAPSLMEMELRSDDRRRHWSPLSQACAPADVLLESLVDDWIINSVVGLEEYWYGGGRHVAIYYFELTKDNQAVIMPVLGNPAVRRLVGERRLRVVLRTGDDIRAYEDEVAEV